MKCRNCGTGLTGDAFLHIIGQTMCPTCHAIIDIRDKDSDDNQFKANHFDADSYIYGGGEES